MPDLTPSELAALKNVRDGKVFQRFDEKGNVYVGPPGKGAKSYRRLEKLRLVEDAPGHDRRSNSYHQRLTDAGRLALESNAEDRRS